MQCPTCQNTDSRVLESRSADSGKSVRRRRECLNCSFRFTTYERVETMPISVIKKDGSRELFDKQKLFTGISRACEKTTFTSEAILNFFILRKFFYGLGRIFVHLFYRRLPKVVRRECYKPANQ